MVSAVTCMFLLLSFWFFFFFFNDTATTEIYTLSLHDVFRSVSRAMAALSTVPKRLATMGIFESFRSEEHTSELQSQSNLVCRLLLENRKAPVRTPFTVPKQMPPSRAGSRRPRAAAGPCVVVVPRPPPRARRTRPTAGDVNGGRRRAAARRSGTPQALFCF